MAMVGLLGEGMEVVDGRHAGQSQGGGHMPGDVGALTVCKMKTLMTSDHTAILERSSGYGRSFRKGLHTGHHEKVPVCYPCSRLAALHGTPRTLLL